MKELTSVILGGMFIVGAMGISVYGVIKSMKVFTGINRGIEKQCNREYSEYKQDYNNKSK